MWFMYRPSYIILWVYMQTQVLYELWDVWYDDHDLQYGIHDV